MNKTHQNQQRDLIQDRALISSSNHNHLALEWSTGCGKTLASIKIINAIVNSNPMAQGYIICKESTHKKNWIDDFKKHGYEYLLERNVEIILYASAHKCSKAEFFIYDEVHAMTPKKLTIFKKLVDQNTVCLYLSATIPDNKRDLIYKLSRGSIRYYSIPLIKAIKMGLLPEPVLKIHRTKLVNGKRRSHIFIMSRGDKDKYVKKTCLHDERWKVFKKHKHIELSVKCNEQEYYDLITAQMEYYKGLTNDYNLDQKVRIACRNKFLNLGSKRKNFIAETKTMRARKLVKKFRDEGSRFICFTGSIAQSKKLGSGSAINSKNSKDHNQALIDCFNNKSCSELFAVKMLREGINLTDIQKGIVVQLDSTMGSFYQMLGRCLRNEFPELHLIILEDTQDEVYFATSMKDFDIKYLVNG